VKSKLAVKIVACDTYMLWIDDSLYSSLHMLIGNTMLYVWVYLG